MNLRLRLFGLARNTFLIIILTYSFQQNLADNTCFNINNILSCYEQFPKNKFTRSNVNVLHVHGINVQECAIRMSKFQWSAGVFCEKSNFCGLGLNLDDHDLVIGSNIYEPSSEICQILVDSTKQTCNDVIKKILDSKLIRSRSTSLPGRYNSLRLMIIR